jgi:hypothetical protein
MDGLPLELLIFLIATFVGALVAGLSGFAFGLVAASIWLYILTPLQTASLIIAFGLIVQGLLGLEAQACTELAKALAVRHRRSDRSARRSDVLDLGKSSTREGGCWCLASPVRPLCPPSSCDEANHGRWRCG